MSTIIDRVLTILKTKSWVEFRCSFSQILIVLNLKSAFNCCTFFCLLKDWRVFLGFSTRRWFQILKRPPKSIPEIWRWFFWANEIFFENFIHRKFGRKSIIHRFDILILSVFDTYQWFTLEREFVFKKTKKDASIIVKKRTQLFKSFRIRFFFKSWLSNQFFNIFSIDYFDDFQFALLLLWILKC